MPAYTNFVGMHVTYGPQQQIPVQKPVPKTFDYKPFIYIGIAFLAYKLFMEGK